MYYEFLSLIAGIVCKIYDDIQDNKNFHNYKKNKFLLELLKGIHFITFTTISIDKPLFFFVTVMIIIIQYITNKLSLQYLTNENSFYKPYENSILYSFSILFLLVDYKKINLNFNMEDYCLIIYLIICIFFEHLLIYKKEICLNKLLIRLVSVIFLLVSLLFINYNDKTIKYLIIYASGYLLVSIMVQYYSLFIVPKNKISIEISNKIKKKIKKNKENKK